MLFHNELHQAKLKTLVTRHHLLKEQGGLPGRSHTDDSSMQEAGRVHAAALAALDSPLSLCGMMP